MSSADPAVAKKEAEMQRVPSSHVFVNEVEDAHVVSGEGDSLGLGMGDPSPSKKVLDDASAGPEVVEKRSDPFWNRAVFILVVEAMERLTYYTLAMNLAHCGFWVCVCVCVCDWGIRAGGGRGGGRKSARDDASSPSRCLSLTSFYPSSHTVSHPTINCLTRADLTNFMGMSTTQALNVKLAWNFSGYGSCLIGALVSDLWLGRKRTILAAACFCEFCDSALWCAVLRLLFF